MTAIMRAYTIWYIEKSGLSLMLRLGTVWLLMNTVESCKVQIKY